jgi:hypothetical protein
MLHIQRPNLGWFRRLTVNEDLLKFHNSNTIDCDFSMLNDEPEVFTINNAYCHTRAYLRAVYWNDTP